MSTSELFIRRPVTTTLVMLGLFLFGVMGYQALPVSDLPSVDFPTIEVRANLSGASPENMAASVATPIERQLSTVAGIDTLSSISTQGQTRITVQFALDRDIDAAALDVQAALSKANRSLPDDMTTPPYFQKVNPADQPIFYLTVASKTLPMSQITEYADTLIGQRVSMIAGVAQVNIYGSKKYAVRAQVDPKLLSARQIGIDEVGEAIQGGNVQLPSGTLYGRDRALTIQPTGKLMNADAYRPLVVAWRSGSPVRLGDLGLVKDSHAEDKSINWVGDEEAVVLAVMRQPGTNTVAVVDAIRKLLPDFERQVPGAVSLNVLYDRSESIRASVDDVKFTLVLTVGLVVLVIFLFLGSATATIIPSLALPMSVTATFAAMHLMGHSLDNLSLMALTLAVGFVVDDAIVMLENIVRHQELGKGRLAAALDGSREIGFTIVSMTISLAAVFIPVLFMGGIVGRLFREFSLVIIVAILLSGFVSLSLTPMLCARFLADHSKRRKGLVERIMEPVLGGWLKSYDWSLRLALKHHRLTFALSLAILWGTAHLFAISPKGFLPSEDVGRFQISTEAIQGASFEAMAAHQRALHPILEADPAVETYYSTVGSGGPNLTGNAGRMMVKLKPREERPEHVDKVIARLRPKLAQVPGIQAYLVNPPTISIGGRTAKSLYQYTLSGPDTEALYQAALALEERMRSLDTIQDVTTDLQLKNPELKVDINRDKASALGVSANRIELALQSAFGAREVSTIFAPTNDYTVILELLPEYQRDAQALSLLHVRSSTGSLVPLDTVATLKEQVGPMSVNHTGQFPSATIAFNLRPGVALGSAVENIESAAREVLPPQVSSSFQGTAQAFQSSLQGMVFLLAMAILVIYIVLGILYESFIHPLTILSGLPSAGLGALLTLYWFDVELSLYAFVGIIMLIGIVKKNAIMMIDFAVEARRERNLSPQEAIYQGCLIRFRPIMMTTMAALMGTLPIAVGFGAGAESRRPLGLAVVGGLVVSQLVTLYITPVYYIYLDRLGTWLEARFSRRGHTAEETVAAEPAGTAKS